MIGNARLATKYSDKLSVYKLKLSATLIDIDDAKLALLFDISQRHHSSV